MEPREYDNDYLVTGLKEGDPVIFKIIYKLYWERLYHVAYYYLKDENDAEDVLQDVFISLWSRRSHLDIRAALENYLVRSVKYTSFFYLKIKMRNKTMMGTLPDVAPSNQTEEYISYRGLLEQLNAIFETTSHKTRDIFYLNRFNGLTYSEIASRLDISVKTVEYHISVALKVLGLHRLV